MLPPGAGRHEPACRGCAPAPRRAAWGTVPGPPGPTMARPQRTPARSPDNIVEVKSKVRAPLAPAPASALGASNSLILPFPSFLVPTTFFLASIIHVPFSGLSSRFPPSILLPRTASRVSPWPWYLEGGEKTLDSVPCTEAEVWAQGCSRSDSLF